MKKLSARLRVGTFFQWSLMFYSKYGTIAPGEVNLWEEYLKWKETPAGQKQAEGLIGSPETIRAKLQEFEASHVDQVILLNQAGKNTHEDICDSLKAIRRRSDAGVSRARGRASGLEESRARG